MSTLGPTTTRTPTQQNRLAPTAVVSAAFGFVVYALAMMSGEVFDLNADPVGEAHDHSFIDSLHLPEMGIGLVGAGIAVWVASRALSASIARGDKYALGLAIAAVLSVPAFWAGWPTIFGAAAIGVAFEQRRRIGSSSWVSGVAVVLGAAAFIAGTVTCALG